MAAPRIPDELFAKIREVQAEHFDPAWALEALDAVARKGENAWRLVLSLPDDKAKDMLDHCIKSGPAGPAGPAAAALAASKAVAGLGSGSSGAAQPDQAEALDPSQQWAIDMVYVDPDEPPPQDAEAVRKFLRQELPKKLPVFQRRLDCLIRDPYAGLLASQYLAVGPTEGFLPALLDVALNVSLGDMKEMTCAASFLGQYTEQLLLQLAAMTGQLALKAARARYAQGTTGTTAPSAQPSCCVWHKGALLFKGEDKVPLHSNMAEAVRELGSNMARTWNGMAMGSLPFIVCYASCGSKLQYHIIKQDTSTALEVSEEFDLNRPAHRILALHTGVNVFRLLKLLAKRVEDVQA